ncbi:MAG: helix-turn-helix domain containing protein [Sphingomonas bacterium]|nr:helix-turn-helix domain containing protein [Sphingomonas bacterium]
MGVDALCCEGPVDRAGLRRRRIIEAARALFVANGFHATGVAQIARESGVAVGQLYRDYAAKEDIVAEIVTGDCETFMARAALAEAIERRDESAVWNWLRNFIEPDDDADADPMFAEIVAESARNERIAGIFARNRDEVTDCMRKALMLLAPGDALAKRRELLADLILTQSLGVTQHRLIDPMFDAKRLTDLVMTVITREIEAMRDS